MEQLSESAPDHHGEDQDILYEDDPVSDGVPVYPTRNISEILSVIPSVLTEAQVLLGYQVDADSTSIYNESDPISQMLRNMEESVIAEKDAEISILKSELEGKNKEIAQFEEKMTKLVDFITFVHGEFGKLLRSMTDMAIQDDSNILHLGPFKNETVKNEFVQNLNGLSINFLGDHENLTGTRELFAKIDMILRSRETVTNNHIANISNENSHPVYSSVEQFNRSVNCASYFTQQTSSSPSSNMNTPPLQPSSCLTNMPPPVSSTHEVPPPATEDREYPVLSILESMLTNVTVPTSQPSSSNMIMKPPPPSPLNLTIRRPPQSISRNSLQAEYGMNLTTANKKHGIDHSKGSWGFFCLCNIRFTGHGKLMDHIKYFTMKNFECVICKKRYHRSNLLKLHMISFHKLECLSGGVVTCSLCQGSFINLKEFQEHLQTIHGIKERQRHTSIQQKHFVNSSPKHVRDISAENPHSCTCGKKYVHRSALITHINTTLYGKVFKCSWCTLRFQTHIELKVHVSKVHGVEKDKQNKFGCTACGKTFPALADIRKHRSEVHRKVLKN